METKSSKARVLTRAGVLPSLARVEGRVEAKICIFDDSLKGRQVLESLEGAVQLRDNINTFAGMLKQPSSL
jgi:hypothetical protein